MKKLLKKLIAAQRGPILICIKWINALLRRVTAFTHKLQFYTEWAISPNPEWFDHFIDQHYQWYASKNGLCWERGVYSALCLKPQATVLDICCGDGFNTYHFYACHSKYITAIDFDPKAIAHAKKFFKSDNIDFQVVDIRKNLPQGKFTNIIWDAAIEHFTLDEMTQIFNNLLDRLTDEGILSGYTNAKASHGPSHHDHEHEFESKAELKKRLQVFFKHVVVFETIYPNRHNLYFYASNAPLQFLNDFQMPLTEEKHKLVEMA